MSSNNVQLNVHRKRPLHPSPAPSFRSVGQERSILVKRPRWDVSSPSPSLPTVSIPGAVDQPIKHQPRPFQFATTAQAFRFGVAQPASSAALDSSSASSGHNRSLSIQTGSNHGSRHKRHRAHSPITPPKPHHSHAQPPVIVTDLDDDEGDVHSKDRNTTLRSLERLRRSIVAEDEQFVLKMRELEGQAIPVARIPDSTASSAETGTCSGFAGSSCSPYLSQSVTSVSASATNSGDGSFEAKHNQISGGRKRSWSVAESDEVSNDMMDMDVDMEWDMVAKRPIQAGILPPSAVDDDFPAASSMDLEGDCNNLNDLDDATEDQDGDDEQEDDEDDEESDDELIFVVSNTSHSNGVLDNHAPSGTRRAIEELSQVMAAGSCSLEDGPDEAAEGMRLDGSSGTLVDAGALWQ